MIMDYASKVKPTQGPQESGAGSALSASAGSLFWRRRSFGRWEYLRVTTERGSKDTGFRICPEWGNSQKIHAHGPDGRRIGILNSDVEAKAKCEKLYLEDDQMEVRDE